MQSINKGIKNEKGTKSCIAEVGTATVYGQIHKCHAPENFLWVESSKRNE